MAASAAVNGFGTTFSYLSTDPSTYTALAEVVAVTPPQWTRETVDVTHMGSDDAYREYIGTLFDGGEVTLTLNYLEAGMTLLQTLIGAGTETFKITLPGSSTIVFMGIPTSVAPSEIVIDDKVTVELTIKVTGKPTFTVV